MLHLQASVRRKQPIILRLWCIWRQLEDWLMYQDRQLPLQHECRVVSQGQTNTKERTNLLCHEILNVLVQDRALFMSCEASQSDFSQSDV